MASRAATRLRVRAVRHVGASVAVGVLALTGLGWAGASPATAAPGGSCPPNTTLTYVGPGSGIGAYFRNTDRNGDGYVCVGDHFDFTSGHGEATDNRA